MHVFYYDEVKYDPPTQASYWLGGVGAAAHSIPSIEQDVNTVADDIFGSRMLSKATEIHGIELVGGRGNFKGRSFHDRLIWLEKLLTIAAREDVYRVYVKINPKNITHSSVPPSEIAFMYLIEQADSMFKEKGGVGMIFGDYDEPYIGSSVASLSRFREGGTDWRRGRDISSIIDTVHFARSHHSRMVQLADLYLYCMQFLRQDNTSGWRLPIAEKIRSSGITRATRAKDWPSEPVWYR
jgi:hypothetical protein